MHPSLFDCWWRDESALTLQHTEATAVAKQDHHGLIGSDPHSGPGWSARLQGRWRQAQHILGIVPESGVSESTVREPVVTRDFEVLREGRLV